jgi:hypothetical protein
VLDGTQARYRYIEGIKADDDAGPFVRGNATTVANSVAAGLK